jgi:hypothetical protein
MPPVENALPTPNAVLRGPFGSLVIVPSGVDAGGLWRFQVFAPHGGAPDSSQIHANQIVQELARDASGLMAIRQLYGNRWGGLVGLSPPMMVARLRRDLADGIMFAAFYIPSWDFTGFAVTNTVDISGLLADPPGTPLNWSPAQRIAAMLRRIPGCMAPALRAEAEALLTPKAVALFAAFAVGLAVSQAFVAGEFVDSILVAAAWWFAGWQGLMALKNFITAIIDAAGETTLVPIQADAQVAADALATLGLLFLAAILHRAGDQEKVMPTEPKPPKEPPPVVKGWKDFPSTADKTAEDAIAKTAGQPAPKGGTYILRDVDGNVVRTGRTNDLARRAAEHARDPDLQDFEFEQVHSTDNYAEQRGLEHMLNNFYNAPFDKINAISPNNPNLQTYLNAGKDYLSRTRK